uniref:YaaA family protein n=1 Tax=uncultured Desulfobulbus sp. TaxID=239745 RepID=UPI00261BADF9
PIDPHPTTFQPEFLEQSGMLIQALARLDGPALAELMQLSPALTEQTLDKIQALATDAAPARPALFAFSGEAFRSLDAASLNEADLQFAQAQLRILSGLYGVLRPFDLIRPHRLEMATRLAVGTAKNLYDFWGELVTASLNRDLAREETPVVLNLASDEYARVVQKKRLTAPWLDIQFKEESNGRLRSVAIHAKRARGLMARFILRERITRAADLRAFSDSGYRFRPELSSEWSWVFARPST